ncbi:MAG: tRNA uridine-5-carboxymethylaminomethyl(34) synthesis enzyme MnmG [Candidatus Aminicenantes bacterium]|nr:tRNA uridine-5-carboxymethylaminomethyl(34) synthesis enzyme MnmG [Candidatus Aminicenantes bacterium]
MKTTAAEAYDVVVVGAGHAGCEAAAAACAMGLSACLVTIHLETIAQMSCNPAIGGVAKGHLVREIDALGGIMGRLADETGIQFRLLNRSRGGAVQAPRAQCDKAIYRLTMKKWLEDIPNLTVFQGIVTDLLVENGKAKGIVTLDGHTIRGKAVLLTPGTFLNGLIHIGLKSYPAGRANEPAAPELSENLKRLGLKTFRLKTGTPMRLDKHSIDWSEFEPQPGDDAPVPFSFRTKKRLENKVVCYAGYTNERTHEVIRKNLDKSPLYSGRITGVGTRYCPSIEDKVVKFPHHSRHQFFLEPEGLETSEIYVNGLSSSLPYETQKSILRTIPGLDQAKILRPAYGIEYDAVSPIQLRPTLETRLIDNLYLAGQINGTSGYEEAAAQGLMAGINAALKTGKKAPFVLRRDEAYIGVLVDDLISKGVEEPYRLFTSRAEYRLRLRIDNADVRLTGYGHDFGLIGDDDFHAFHEKKERVRNVIYYLEKKKIAQVDKEKISLKDYLKKPEIHFENMLEYGKIPEVLTDEEVRHVEAEIKYEGYLKKQEKEVAKILKIDGLKIPEKLDFKKIHGLTREAVEKMDKQKPRTIRDMKKIPGLTPSDVFCVYVYLNARNKKKAPGDNVPRGTIENG